MAATNFDIVGPQTDTTIAVTKDSKCENGKM